MVLSKAKRAAEATLARASATSAIVAGLEAVFEERDVGSDDSDAHFEPPSLSEPCVPLSEGRAPLWKEFGSSVIALSLNQSSLRGQRLNAERYVA